MGAGVPNANACKILYPDRKVISVSGDGGFMMNEAELATCIQYDMNIVHVILNDSSFGMIKWKQGNAGFDYWGLDLKNPDFVALAESYGAHGHRVTSAEEFGPLLAKCLDSNGTHVIEVPFSYEWFSAELEETEKECRHIVEMVENEFGTCLIDCKSHGHDDAAQTEAEATPPKASVKQTHMASAPASVEKPSEAKHQKLVTSKKDYVVQKGSSLPFYLGGDPFKPNENLAVLNKYTGEEFCKVALADESHVDKAIEIAAGVGAKKMRELPAYVRQQILQNVVDEATRRRDEFGYYLAIEAGKPIKDARGEADRLIQTFKLAAEESTRIYGEYADLEIAPRAAGYSSVTKRVPVGPVSLISPFNFPLNLAAHKVAPAIAAGCPFVLKPASKTPLGALLIGEILANDPNMPPEGFSILPCSREAGNLLTTDNRFKLMSFTGSPDVGYALKDKASKKPVVLEVRFAVITPINHIFSCCSPYIFNLVCLFQLGGNAACIIDDLDVGLSQLVDEVVHGAFYQSGQSCISVQRLFVRDTIYEKFRDAFVSKVKTLKAGDPLDEDTFIGPVISEDDAKRVESWVQEAVEGGATLLCGGKRFDRVFVSPAVVENVPRTAKLYAEEVFGPAVCIEKYSDFKTAVAEVNNSRFGLQAGVYTNNFNYAHYAFDKIDAGGVCINSTPSVRIDSQAYGGVKDSGLGREGIKYAIEDYTEVKVMVMKNAGKI
jgi:acyl-CoA reductase-like NAD-dependent aldehyde dehydrogenase